MADEDVVVARIPVIINNWSKDREPQKTVPTGIIPPVPADSPPTTTLFASAAVPTLPQKSRKLYLIQYPLRPSDRPLLVDNSLSTQQEQKLPVRIKPSVDILQMLFPLDKQSDHYSAERGSQLRKGLESAYIVENAPASALQQLQQQSQKQQQGKINGAEPFSAMDCTADPAERYMAEKNRWTTGGIPMEAHKVLEGQSDSGTIMVGWWSEDCSALHLTPLDAVLQSRPHLKHIDAIEALQKQQQQASRRSDQQTDESGVSEAEDQAAVAAAVANKRMALQVNHVYDRLSDCVD